MHTHTCAQHRTAESAFAQEGLRVSHGVGVSPIPHTPLHYIICSCLHFHASLISWFHFISVLAIAFFFQWLSSLYLSFTAAVLSLSSKYHYSGIFCKEFSGFYPPIKSVCASIVSTVHMVAIHLKIATMTDKLLVLALFSIFRSSQEFDSKF